MKIIIIIIKTHGSVCCVAQENGAQANGVSKLTGTTKVAIFMHPKFHDV